MTGTDSQFTTASLRRYLTAWQARSLIWIGAPPGREQAEWIARRDCALTLVDPGNEDPLPELAALGRFDMALVPDLNSWSRAIGQQLLGRLKNLHTHRICLHVQLPAEPIDAHWCHGDLLGLGFRRAEGDPASGAWRYYYDLASYNPARSWNNPRFWANPENFHRYRW